MHTLTLPLIIMLVLTLSPAHATDEKEVLTQFYHDFGGAQWAESSGWLYNSPCCVNPPQCTQQWFGVICINTTRGTEVFSLSLSENNMVGNMSDAANLCLLPSLGTVYILLEPQITGLVPDCFSQVPWYGLILSGLGLEPAPLPTLDAAKEIVEFSLSGNSFTGPIPDSYAGMAHTVSLFDLSGNELTGTIPSWLDTFEVVTVLKLAENKLVGRIPPAILALEAVNYIDLSMNNLTGPIPDALGPVRKNFTYLRIDHNNLVSPVPPSFRTALISYLRFVDIGYNNFDDPLAALFPESYTATTSPPSIQTLNVAGCALSGTIPFVLANYTNLVSLSFAHNQLEGTIPGFLSTLPSLSLLDVSYNDFTEFSSTFTPYLSSLQALKLRGNNFRHLPHVFGLSLDSVHEGGGTCTWTSQLTFLDISELPLIPSPHSSGGEHSSSSSSSSGTGITNRDLFDMLIVAHNEPIVKLRGYDMALACVETLGSPYGGLQTLSASNIGLKDSLLAFVFLSFSRLTHLELQNNHLFGPLPQSAIVIPFVLPWSLSYVDLSSNNLTGPIPEPFGTALSSNLRFFNLGNNPMTIGRTLPYFLTRSNIVRVDYSRYSYSCWSLTTLSRDAYVVVDPQATDMALCSCTPGYFGIIDPSGTSGCIPLKSACADTRVCATNDVSTTTTSDSPDVFYPAEGYWPSPNPDDAVTFLRCTDFPHPPGRLPCNPGGATPGKGLTCRVTRVDDLGHPWFTCETPEAVCQPGTTGRLCGRCTAGFFMTMYGCSSCPDRVTTTASNVIGSLTIVIIGTSLLFLRLSKVSVKELKLRRMFHAHPSVLGFFRAYLSEIIICLTLSSALLFLALVVYPVDTLNIVILVLFSYYYLYWIVRKAIPADLDAAVMEVRADQDPSLTLNTSHGSSSTSPLLLPSSSINAGAQERHHTTTADAMAASFRLTGEADPALVLASSDRGGSSGADLTSIYAGANADGTMGGFLGDTQISEVKAALAIAQGIFKTLVMYMQTVESITMRSVIWPNSWSWIISLNDFVMSSQLRHCWNSAYTYLDGVGMVIFTPAVFCVSFFIIFLIWYGYKLIRKAYDLCRLPSASVDADIRRDTIHAMHARSVRSGWQIFVSVSILLLYLTLYPVLVAYWSLFSCSPDPTVEYDTSYSESFLVSDPAVACFGDQVYFDTAIPCSVLVFIYLAGGMFVFSRVNKHGRAGRLHRAHVKLRYSILYESFRPGAWWFEQVLTLRRIILAIATATLPTSAFSAIGIVGTLVIALGLQAWYHPYSTPMANLMEIICLASAVISFIISQTALRFFQSDPTNTPTLTGPAIVLNNLVVWNTFITLLTLAFVAIAPFVRILPFVRHRDFRIFRWMGLTPKTKEESNPKKTNKKGLAKKTTTKNGKRERKEMSSVLTATEEELLQMAAASDSTVPLLAPDDQDQDQDRDTDRDQVEEEEEDGKELELEKQVTEAYAEIQRLRQALQEQQQITETLEVELEEFTTVSTT